MADRRPPPNASSSHQSYLAKGKERQKDREMSANDDDNSPNTDDRKGGGSGINRVNRACNHCRRMKMRCVGAEDPPCKRCRHTGQECILEKPSKPHASGGLEVGDDRIRHLESTVTSIQSTLADLVSAIRSGGVGPSPPQQPVVASSPASTGSEFARRQTMSNPSPRGMAMNLGPQRSSSYSQPGVQQQNTAAAQPSVHTSPSELLLAAAAASNTGGGWGGMQYGAGIGIDPVNATRQGRGSGDGTAWMTSPSQPTQPPPPENGGLEAMMRSAGIDLNRQDQPWMNAAGQPSAAGYDPSKASSSQYPRLPPQIPSHLRTQANFSTFVSPNGSDEEVDQDPLASDKIMAPLQGVDSMAELAQAAVDRANLEQQGQRGKDRAETSTERPSKRRKLEGEGKDDSTLHGTMMIANAGVKPPDTHATGPVLVDDPNNRSAKGRKKKPHIHAYPDVVALGLVPEAEARELFDLYFAGSSNFVPVYDPAVDTWDALRIRSPFSISTIVSVGARVRDGGGYMSETYRASLDHARKIAIGTMFTPVARVEAVQAMVLLAAFNDNGWLPGGHAVRMAVDMGLDKCFMKLVKLGMGAGKTAAEVEDQRPLVIGARVWFGLYLMEHQMSYGTGRPAIVREDESIAQCRRFLEHPLSILSDTRLISTVELIAMRAPLHVVLTSSPEDPVDQETVARLQKANLDFDKWQAYWDKVFTDKFGKNKTDFFRESLQAQRQYSSLFINSQLLRGVSEAADVRKLSKEKRDLAIQAMRNAQTCLDICVRGTNYREGLRYAPHYTHVCAAFAASFLIRIARLFPKELDLKRTAKDIEELASVLAQAPAGRYARSLRLILRKARKQKVIPPPSVPASPTKAHVELPNASTNTTANQLSASRHTPATGPSPHAQQHPTPSNQFSIPAFSPNQLFNHAMLAHNATGLPTSITQMSPGMIAPGMQTNESPQSAGESFGDFDFGYAQELMNKAGIPIGEDQQLPLFLNGESLGNGDNSLQNIGLETFFLPPDIDMRLTSDIPNQPALDGLQNASWPLDPLDLTNMWW